MKKINFSLTALIIAGMLIAGCPSAKSPTPSEDGRNYSHVSLNGAGASFPYPIYSRWGFEYQELTGLQLNYQSVGSGAGISSIQAGTVDFGASDAPLTEEELELHNLLQFPLVIGGIVLVVNLPGIEPGQMRLSTDVLTRIYLGEITKWNDSAIVEINPGLNMPNMPISLVHRADGSGTTWIFTSYLSAISEKWAERVGAGKSVEWPSGIGGRGNEGVASYVSQVEGAIGYVESAYALQNDMTYTMLENSEGNYISPNIDTFEAAASNADWAGVPGYYMILVNQPGLYSWPIVGASFILVHRNQKDLEKARAMIDFFIWCMDEGRSAAIELDYVPMPKNVADLIKESFAAEIKYNGVPVLQQIADD
ncbi:MAG TPA: phosphate ABC transporter substrate-binding protein PstS [Firmicutes bacterium]|nr:phosphate ABC transporter substrate-binding protein PstS [Bacillota bacterium]